MSEPFLWTALYVWIGFKLSEDKDVTMGEELFLMLTWPMLAVVGVGSDFKKFIKENK